MKHDVDHGHRGVEGQESGVVGGEDGRTVVGQMLVPFAHDPEIEAVQGVEQGQRPLGDIG